jgi:hypothetical protein
MINFTTPNGSIQVKSSYYDLTCAEYARILERPKDFDFVFSVLTGIPEDEILTHDLSSVVDFISFLNESARDLDPLEFVTIGEKDYSEVSVWEDTWSRKITADKLVRVIKSEDEFEEDQYIVPDLVELVAIYTTKQKKKFDDKKIERTRKVLDKMPVAEVYPFGLHLEKQLTEINKHERKLLKSEYTPEQLQAGIHEFNKLGVFNTIDMIAQGDPLKYDKVFNLPFSSVFNKLLLSNISVKFDKRLSKILRDKSKPIGK